MATQLFTDILIQASSERVWSVLTDFKGYPDWNPFLLSLEGEVQEGKRITIKIGNMTIRPRVLVVEKNRKLVWLGHLCVRGLFDGRHEFRIEPQPDGSTRFIHRETFGGILVPLLKNMLEKETKPGFEAMNRVVKAKAEQG